MGGFRSCGSGGGRAEGADEIRGPVLDARGSRAFGTAPTRRPAWRSAVPPLYRSRPEHDDPFLKSSPASSTPLCHARHLRALYVASAVGLPLLLDQSDYNERLVNPLDRARTNPIGRLETTQGWSVFQMTSTPDRGSKHRPPPCSSPSSVRCLLCSPSLRWGCALAGGTSGSPQTTGLVLATVLSSLTSRSACSAPAW